MPAPKRPLRTGAVSLHLVENSLRDVQSGYTIRTHQWPSRSDGPAWIRTCWWSARLRRATGSTSVVDDVDYHWLPGATGLRRASDVSWDELAGRGARLLDELLPEVLHAATPPTVGNFGRALARWSGLPLVYEVRGFRDEFWLLDPDDDTSVDHSVISRRADTEVMGEADAVVTLGEQMRAEVVARGVEPERVSIVPNAVDTTRFRPGPRDADVARSYGFGRDDAVIGYISSFQPYEDFQTLVERSPRCAPRAGVCVGSWQATDRPSRRSGRRSPRSAWMASCCCPAVPHEDLPRYHRLIDIFVVPRVDARPPAGVTAEDA